MDGNNTDEHLRELVRLQSELVELQKRQLGNSERDFQFRRKLLVILAILFAVWLFLQLAPIWLW